MLRAAPTLQVPDSRDELDEGSVAPRSGMMQRTGSVFIFLTHDPRALLGQALQENQVASLGQLEPRREQRDTQGDVHNTGTVKCLIFFSYIYCFQEGTVGQSCFFPQEKKCPNTAQLSFKLHIVKIIDASLNKKNPPNPPCRLPSASPQRHSCTPTPAPHPRSRTCNSWSAGPPLCRSSSLRPTLDINCGMDINKTYGHKARLGHRWWLLRRFSRV